jgi:hypothetical protein
MRNGGKFGPAALVALAVMNGLLTCQPGRAETPTGPKGFWSGLAPVSEFDPETFWSSITPPSVFVPDTDQPASQSTIDCNTPVLPPIPQGTRPLCENPPESTDVLRALPPVAPGVPGVMEIFRDDIDFAFECLVDEIDVPRFFPMVGQAQVHRCHYKCTAYFTDTIRCNYPFPFEVKKRRCEVVYIDRDHSHTCENPAEHINPVGDIKP